MGLPLLIGVGLASFAVSEVIAALLESWTGDPEASVQAALAQIQAKAQQDAMSTINQPGEVKEDVARAFKGVRPRGMGELALYNQGIFDSPEEKPVLSYVTRQLGISPQDFMQRTSPTRMGDLSTFQRSLNPNMLEKPAAPPPLPQQAPQPSAPPQGMEQPQTGQEVPNG